MSLENFEFKPDYNKAIDDIANEFYIPCIENSIGYDRISGYFGSTIYIIAWDGIKTFIKNNGKMRIICSPLIVDADKNAITEGIEAQNLEAQLKILIEEMNYLFKDEILSKPTRALACFVAMGVVEIKIAISMKETTPDIKRLFHDKIGIFKDSEGNSVGFRGSMNETYKGLAKDGNLESIDVFPSWEDFRDKERVNNAINYFNDLWDNKVNGVEVIKFPEVPKEIFTKYTRTDDWEVLVDEVNVEINKINSWSAEKKAGGKKPRPHQIEALEAWKNNNYFGIFEHATGSGKTFTAICAIKHLMDKGYVPLILVPSLELLTQWHNEITNSLLDIANLHLYLCGDDNNLWKRDGNLLAWTDSTLKKPRIIISSMDTAASDLFIKSINQGKHLFIVADEVHKIGSPYRRNILNIDTGARLGLSATPRRFGDEVGTAAIFNYFGVIIPPVFTLDDAIKAGVLTRYFYYPHEIQLTQDEQEEWDKISEQISKKIAMEKTNNMSMNEILNNENIKLLLIKRARIVKNASGKIGLAKKIINENYEPNQKWLVYCDNQIQLERVLHKIKALNLDVFEYHSNMPGDRKETLKYFSINGGIIVSIKCLDEGVDIPEATHALILASSKNPREFIQRRGRILRKSKNKIFSVLYDAIVTPQKTDKDFGTQTSIIEGELARAIKFGSGAENPTCITKLNNIAIEYGLNIDEAMNRGEEDDE